MSSSTAVLVRPGEINGSGEETETQRPVRLGVFFTAGAFQAATYGSDGSLIKRSAPVTMIGDPSTDLDRAVMTATDLAGNNLVVGAGIAFPGELDERCQTIVRAGRAMKFVGMPIAGIFRAAFPNAIVRLRNDAVVRAMQMVRLRDLGTDGRLILSLSLGEGLGSAIAWSRGDEVPGVLPLEWAHERYAHAKHYEDRGRPRRCSCGGMNHLQAYSGSDWIVDYGHRVGRDPAHYTDHDWRVITRPLALSLYHFLRRQKYSKISLIDVGGARVDMHAGLFPALREQMIDRGVQLPIERSPLQYRRGEFPVDAAVRLVSDVLVA